MPNYNAEIKNFVLGDNHDVRYGVTNVPYGQHIIMAWLTVKNSVTDSDDAAVFQKVITEIVSADGQILDNGNTNQKAVLLFQLSGADTSALAFGIRYNFDVQIITNNNFVSTPYIGKIYGKAQYTISTS